MKKNIVIAVVLIFALLLQGCDSDKYEITTTGMGTVITQTLYGGSAAEADALNDIFKAIEDASSLNVEGSAVCLLNETGVTDNKFLIEQADICLSVFMQSDGAFDFTVEPITELWGIGTDEARVPTQAEIDELLKNVDSSQVTISNENSDDATMGAPEGELVLSLGEGQKVSFGAIGKGYACDKAADYLKKTEIKRAVIAVGGSLLFYGKKTGGWTVGVKSPFDQSTIIGTFKYSGGFVSTSGSYERYFEQDGTVYHHIIDTKTGYPVNNGLVSVTVAGTNGALTDALSTACFALGEEKGRQLLSCYGFSGIFIYGDGRENNISVYGDLDFKQA